MSTYADTLRSIADSTLEMARKLKLEEEKKKEEERQKQLSIAREHRISLIPDKIKEIKNCVEEAASLGKYEVRLEWHRGWELSEPDPLAEACKQFIRDNDLVLNIDIEPVYELDYDMRETNHVIYYNHYWNISWSKNGNY